MSREITQLTAPNETVLASNGVHYRYRRYGKSGNTALPLLLLQHFGGNLENWDPALVDALAEEREIILVDTAGVAGSTGVVPISIRDMAHDVVVFTNAIGLAKYDLLGFSMGGFIAQIVALIRPHQVRRLVLAGTGPEGGRNMPGPGSWNGKLLEAITRVKPEAEDLLTVFFEGTDSSRAAGEAYVMRIFTRVAERDDLPDLPTREAQHTAIMDWSVPDETRLVRLAAIVQPTLVANGDNDIVVPTENTYRLADLIPNARLSIYPDSGHGFLYQYPTEFAAEVNGFLGQ